MSRRSSTKAENETNQNNSTHIQAHYDKTPVIYIRNLNNKHEYTLSERIEPGTFLSFESKSDNIVSVHENEFHFPPLVVSINPSPAYTCATTTQYAFMIHIIIIGL